MDKRIGFQEIITEYISKGYTLEEILDHFTQIANEMVDNEVDFFEFKRLTQPFLDMDKTYLPLNGEELDDARNNLYKQYEIAFDEDEKIIENSFYELSKFDKLIKQNGQPIPYLLNQLLISIANYIKLLETWTNQRKLDTLNRTIAHTSSTTPEKMLSPLNPFLKENNFNTAAQVKVLQNISKEFINDPYKLNISLATVRQLAPESFQTLEQDKVKAFFNATNFLNSTGQVHYKDIINSLKIFISVLYLKEGFFQKVLKTKKHISKEKLATHIDVFITHLFEINSHTSPTKLGSSYQVRMYYEDIPIYEYVRKGKEKKHPMLNDQELMDEISEKIKGKVPPKHSGKTF